VGIADTVGADDGVGATAVIRLHREAAPRRDVLRMYRVLIDGRAVGHIGRCETRDFPVTPGEHRLRLKIDWATSSERVASVARAQVAEFTCKPGGSAWAVQSAVFRPRQYIALEGPMSAQG
jgi:hypothetical protein